MQMSRGVFLMANLVLALCLTGSAAQEQEVAGELELPTAKLVNTMRLLNTAEVSYRGGTGRFASQGELLAFFRQRNLLGKSPLDLENPAPYQVQITTDPDGTHFQIAIKRPSDMNDKSTWCRTAAFSDDAGVIFLGQAIDCPAAPH
jgi:hypothetical protein